MNVYVYYVQFFFLDEKDDEFSSKFGISFSSTTLSCQLQQDIDDFLVNNNNRQIVLR